MSEFERTREPESTPGQAKTLLGWVEEITRGPRGKQYGHADGFGDLPIEVAPPEVAAHFPEPDSMAKSVDYSLYVSRENDFDTHQPRTEGTLADVMFTQKEDMDDDLIYATRLNYHIVSIGGQLGLERHIAHTEHGWHKVAKMQAERRRPLGERVMSGLIETKDLLASLDESRPAEKASGLLTVTETEAQQIIDFCRDL